MGIRPSARFLALLVIMSAPGGLPATPAGAQVLSKCAAAKKVCVAKKVKALFDCYAKADKKGVPVDTVCLTKAQDRFDGGATPIKGCFTKIEAKQNPAKAATLCPSVGDAAVIEGEVDAFVSALTVQLAGGLPGETCTNASPIGVGALPGQSTTGYADDFAPCGVPGGFDGPDRVYAILVPSGKTVTVAGTPTGLDGVSLALFRGLANCGATSAANCESVDTPGGIETVQVSGTNSGMSSEVFYLLAGSPGTDPVTFDLVVTIP